ncbi:hypothetical protein [Salegentibacter mishustinae]|uniref:Uncharacterized protein n=1 Tax=Salegentibacter mishustinae TaxID=270918 RepID=A0A0Q9ZG86_9FLAO|nr:hypothetical protein [Salegentibacter mishustinae]KRG28634.1 hypothetical protein APR42_07625 [Salegentibacter mishustinae]PZX67812.1 hypothetical protein LY54_00550 [Salegentibacter mishustinae]GGW77201.1 hypothetical protein GCM10008086_00660 [Salegentibacter mishustinae]
MLEIEKGIYKLNEFGLICQYDKISMTLLMATAERDNNDVWFYPVYILNQEWGTEKDALDMVELISIARIQLNLPQNPDRDFNTINFIKYGNGIDVTDIRYFGT